MRDKDSECCRCRSKWHNHPNQELTLTVIFNPVYSRQPCILAQRSCWGEGLNVHLCSLAAHMQHKYRSHVHESEMRACSLVKKTVLSTVNILFEGVLLPHVSCLPVPKKRNNLGMKQIASRIFASIRREPPHPHLNKRINISKITQVSNREQIKDTRVQFCFYCICRI